MKKIILFQYRPNIRLYKWAFTLQQMGYDVTVSYTTRLTPDLKWNLFNVVVRNFLIWEDYNVFVSFNPGIVDSVPGRRFNGMIIQAVGDLKGILDHNPIERKILSYSHKNVFVSPDQMKCAIDNYNIHPDKCSVLYNGVLRDMMPEQLSPEADRSGVVYSGTITDKRSHRNIHSELKKCLDVHGEVHVYPSPVLGCPDVYKNNPGIIIHPSVHPYHLIYELSKYKTGIITLDKTGDGKRIAEMCVPNKYFEYRAAGVEVVADEDFKSVHAAPKDPHFYEDRTNELKQIIEG